MRIISKFKDYYDNAMSLGQDSSITYIREKKVYEEIPTELLPFIKRVNNSIYISRHSPEYRNFLSLEAPSFYFREFIVAFCGKIYRGIKVTQRNPIKGIDPVGVYDIVNFQEVNSYCYDLDSVDLLMDTLKQDWYRTEKRRFSFYRYTMVRENLIAYFNETVPDIFPIASKLCIKNLVLDHNDKTDKFILTQDESLDTCEFYKILDPYTAYQELSMFVSGILTPENNPTEKIADKYKVMQHGFNCYSFKKDPSKNKPKPCK